MPEPKIAVTDTPDAADIAVINDGLRDYNTSQAGYDDYKPLAVFVTDPATGKVEGGPIGGSYMGQPARRPLLPARQAAPRPDRQPGPQIGRGRGAPPRLHAGDADDNGNPSPRLLPKTGLRDGCQTRLPPPGITRGI